MTNSSSNYTTLAVKDYSGFHSYSNNYQGLDLEELEGLADAANGDDSGNFVSEEVKQLAEVIPFPVPAKPTQSPSVDPTPAKQADVLRVDFVGVPSVIPGDEKGVIETNRTAPAFRQRKAFWNKWSGQKPTDAETEYLRHWQILDLLHLHQMGKRDPLEGIYENLFTGDKLNMELTKRLVATRSMELKVIDTLKLTDFEQWQCAALQSKEVQEQWKNARKIVNTTIEMKLRRKAERDRTFAPLVAEFKNLWLVDHIAGNESLTIRVQLFAQMTGTEPLNKADFKVKLRRLDRALK